MANMYRSVLSGGGGVVPTGDAQVGDVLAGKTFSNADGIDKTGTMMNNGAVTASVTPTTPYTVPAGYHNGSGVISCGIQYLVPVGKAIHISRPRISAAPPYSPDITDISSAYSNTYSETWTIANTNKQKSTVTLSSEYTQRIYGLKDDGTWEVKEVSNYTTDISNYLYIMAFVNNTNATITFS